MFKSNSDLITSLTAICAAGVSCRERLTIQAFTVSNKNNIYTYVHNAVTWWLKCCVLFRMHYYKICINSAIISAVYKNQWMRMLGLWKTVVDVKLLYRFLYAYKRILKEIKKTVFGYQFSNIAVRAVEMRGCKVNL